MALVQLFDEENVERLSFAYLQKTLAELYVYERTVKCFAI